MTALQNTLLLTGRLLLAYIFVMSGWNKIGGFEGTVGYITSVGGLPVPTIAAIIAIIVEMGGGLLIVAGYKARWAAAALAIFTLVTALFFHAYWAAPAEEMQNQMIHFMKNLAIAGGLLYVAACGSGAYSLDRAVDRRSHVSHQGDTV